MAYDLHSLTAVKNITLRFLQNTNDWILAPQAIEIYTSTDGSSWKKVHTERYNPDFRETGNIIRTDAIRDLKLNTRYLRIVAVNPGPVPDWNPAHGQPSYLFCDEIVIE